MVTKKVKRLQHTGDSVASHVAPMCSIPYMFNYRCLRLSSERTHTEIKFTPMSEAAIFSKLVRSLLERTSSRVCVKAETHDCGEHTVLSDKTDVGRKATFLIS